MEERGISQWLGSSFNSTLLLFALLAILCILLIIFGTLCLTPSLFFFKIVQTCHKDILYTIVSILAWHAKCCWCTGSQKSDIWEQFDSLNNCNLCKYSHVSSKICIWKKKHFMCLSGGLCHLDPQKSSFWHTHVKTISMIYKFIIFL